LLALVLLVARSAPVPAPNSRAAPHRFGASGSGAGRKAGAAAKQQWRALERQCRESPDACGALPLHTEEACTLRCQSPRCFERAFGADEAGWPEPGEVDSRQAGAYSRCLRSLEKRLKRERRWPPVLEPGASAFDDSGALPEEDRRGAKG